jgi:hypothetical protein
MTIDECCAQFTEELTGSSPLSAACQEHLAGCPACRGGASTVRALVKEPSAYAPALTKSMAAQTLSHLPLDQVAAAVQAMPPAVPASGFRWALLTAGLTGALWLGSGQASGPPTTTPNPATSTIAAQTALLPQPAEHPDHAEVVAPTALPSSDVSGLDGE